jgi:hypothetical protein
LTWAAKLGGGVEGQRGRRAEGKRGGGAHVDICEDRFHVSCFVFRVCHPP